MLLLKDTDENVVNYLKSAVNNISESKISLG